MCRPVAMAAGAGRRVKVLVKVEGWEVTTRLLRLADGVKFASDELTPPHARLYEPLRDHVGRHLCRR
jgi:hypothetical protein